MNEDDRRYLWDQLQLFPGGYEHLMIEFTVHLRADVDELQVGWVVSDHRTGERVASQVPQLAARLCDTHKVADEVRQTLAAALERIDPFP